MVDIAKALNRPASYTTKYFAYELRVLSQLYEHTGVALLWGAHDTAKLSGLLEKFIKKFVQCHGCGNLKTEVIVSEPIQLECAACGFLSDVDMRDRLATFILKNPPGITSYLRRAERSRFIDSMVRQNNADSQPFSASDARREVIELETVNAKLSATIKSLTEELDLAKRLLVSAHSEREDSERTLLTQMSELSRVKQELAASNFRELQLKSSLDGIKDIIFKALERGVLDKKDLPYS